MKINNVTPGKLITWAIIVLIVIIIIWIIYRKIQKAVQSGKDKQLVSEADNAIISNALTYPQADYKSMADKLFVAMDGAGTDEDAIKEVIAKLRTKSDWYALVKAFGVRKSTSMFSSFSGNLIQWLADELSGSDRKEVNDMLVKFDVQI